jgi:predicted component of type VI protein secretion system
VPKIVAAEQGTPAVLPGAFRLSVKGPENQSPAIHAVDAPFLLIGRARGCGLRLDHPSISRRHLYLQATLGRIYWVDLSSRNGTRRPDGKRNADWLRQDQPIHVGPYEVRLAAAEGLGEEREDLPEGFSPLDRYAGQFGPLPKVEIEFLTGAGDQKNSAITRLITLGGSSGRCKVRFQDKSVSTIHFGFLLTRDGLWVVDLAGNGGTSVNGRNVLCEQLRDRDKLRVGTFLMRVHYSGEMLGAPVADLTPPAIEARPQFTPTPTSTRSSKNECAWKKSCGN